MMRSLVLLVVVATLVTGCAEATVQTRSSSTGREAKAPHSSESKSSSSSNFSKGTVLQGQASYYSDKLAGRHTANGERYKPNKFTAAHLKLPFDTVVKVTRLDTGASVVVRINDRGPYGRNKRIIDLSKAAAKELDMMGVGVAWVSVEIIGTAKAR